MREWLTVIIVLLIIGILLDGFRRMRAHRRETVRLSKNMVDTDPLLEEVDLTGSEFPSGGARVASYREETDVDSVHQNLKDSYAASRKTRGAPKREPEQSALNLETPVPMLMESVRQNQQSNEEELDRDGFEPSIGSLDDLDDEAAAVTEPWPSAGDTIEPKPAAVKPQTHSRAVSDKPTSKSEPSKPVTKEPVEDEPVLSAPKPAKAKEEPAKKAQPLPPAPDEVLVINVMARRGEVFPGDALLQAILNVGFRYGDMDIFHRHQNSDGTGKVLFSMANMVKPGTFDLDGMDSFETPGISMFLTLPIEGDSLAAFNLMSNAAQAVADALNGELKDENRSVMTRQTIEHSRQRVIEYERKRRLAKA